MKIMMENGTGLFDATEDRSHNKKLCQCSSCYAGRTEVNKAQAECEQTGLD